ncbi:MAG: hypothetical protein GF311_22645 [Candidatus Lokiarchaeota archaeon]|nr:hypothetical protein [Candidatus Lokiarchaeota archaeon]
MNKKRKITIKDPHLRKIRTNLRNILSEVVINSITEMREYEEDFGFSDPNDHQCYLEYSKRVEALDTVWKESICVCPICGSREKDMTYNPELKEWDCVDCYQEHREWYETHDHPEGRSNPFP